MRSEGHYPILALAGRKGVGKSTVAEEILKIVPGAVQISFADPLKELCHSVFGVSKEVLYGPSQLRDVTPIDEIDGWESSIRISKFLNRSYGYSLDCETCERLISGLLRSPKTVRELLQTLGTDVLRKTDPDIWVTLALTKADKMLKAGASFVVMPDLRFRNELLALKKLGARAVYLTPEPLAYFKLQTDKHQSEMEFENVAILSLWFDGIVCNDRQYRDAYSTALEALGGNKSFEILAENNGILWGDE